MKMNVEVECTPEEARTFLGLPDVTKVNEQYVDNITKAMQGVTSLDQLKEVASQIAPMGMMGMQFFQNMIEAGAKAAMGKTKG